MSSSLARRVVGRLLPQPLKTAIRTRLEQARERRLDAQLVAAARRGMVPPDFMWAMVGGSAEQGGAFLDYLIAHGGLTPSSSVLDIGCGVGKHAMHLAGYLVPPGRYEGFDIEPVGVRWCQLAITSRHPHMKLQKVPLRSAMYAPDGSGRAADFVFPYPDASFDVVFLASVFTHMFEAEVENYVREIARVLKPGGRCVATMYLLNDERRRGIAAGTAAFTFAIPHEGAWIDCIDPPEGAVAHEEDKALAMFAAAGLKLAEPVHYGAWDTMMRHDQDFIIATKP